MFVVVVDPASCSRQDWRNFDTCRSSSHAVQLRDFIRRLSYGTVLVGVSCDEASRHLGPAVPTLGALGADVSDVRNRGAFAFVAEKGDPSKTVLDKVLDQEAAMRLPQVNASFALQVRIIYSSLFHQRRQQTQER